MVDMIAQMSFFIFSYFAYKQVTRDAKVVHVRKTLVLEPLTLVVETTILDHPRLAYLLGLCVSPSQRMGIGLKLVKRMEERIEEKGVEYLYVAIEKDNEAFVKHFTNKCGYSKFRMLEIFSPTGVRPMG